MFNNNVNFYPTPTNLIDKMLSGIDFKNINSVLEPSAGKGDIAEAVKDNLKYSRSYGYRDHNWDIDTIEIDQNLQHILKGKNIRVIHDDFLTLNTYKRYDLIVMNPPFDQGDKHLLKAIELQSQGGKIVCLLNAETLKNPYNNTRKDLQRKLEEYNAEIEYIQNAFIDAERKTNVEIALIKIDIPKNEYNSTILNDLKQEEQFKTESEYNTNTLIDADFIKGIIQQYNFEIKAGLKLISEHKALQPYILTDLKQSSYSILELSLHYKDEDGNCSMENSYIKQVRSKYWKALFTSNQFMGLFTNNLRQEYYDKVSELRNYDFSLYNIYTIKAQLHKEMLKGVEDTILNLFDEFSHKYSYHDEHSPNIHYYNGWKTNKAYKINKKVVILLDAFNRYDGRLSYEYRLINKLEDIQKVFNYLDNGITEDIDIEEVLKMAEKYGETKKIQLKYFTVTFYKKSTCHIEFTNMELLHKFNVYGSQRKNWLPPVYGKSKYKDMTKEEQEIIKEFEGEVSYNKVMSNKDYYIVETSKLLMLA